MMTCCTLATVALLASAVVGVWLWALVAINRDEDDE